MKQDPTITIQSEDYYLAQKHWVDFWAAQKMPIPSFSNYLGMSNDPIHRMWISKTPNKIPTVLRYDSGISIRASAARKVALLSGTYWHAILKAYQIRKKK